MSDQITKEQLVALSQKDLLAKYVEVVGDKPTAVLSKDQLADAILEKLPEQAPTDTTPPAPQNPTLDNGIGSPIVPPTPPAQQEEQPKSGPIVPPDQTGNSSVSVTDSVELVKLGANGEVLDKLTLPRAVWNNLSAGHKKDWKVKTPADIQI